MKIVLLPGLDGTGDLFQPFAALTPSPYESVIVRLPPLGDYASLLEHVRRHLPSDPRLVILGESFSGPLALAVARAEPSRVAAVILVNSFVAPPLTRLLQYLPWALLFRFPPPRWVVRRYFVGRDAPPELVASVRAAVAKTPRDVLAARMRAVFRLPRSSPRGETRMLVLASADDAMVRMNARSLEGAAADVVIRTIRGPHLLLQAKPREAWEELLTFFNMLRL